VVGTPAIGAVVALWGFWILLCVGCLRGDLGPRGAGIFLGLWLAGFIGLGLVPSGFLFAPYVTILDIALVFAVFHGDVRLT
jgi:hypothetical protein